MSAALVALTLGTLLAVGALAFVLYPLFFGIATHGARSSSDAAGLSGTVAVAALREIEFDRATGKLSEIDYAQLKEQYTREALAGMRRAKSVETSLATADDGVEAAIRAYRLGRPSCRRCGPRPEPDAIFCSTCGGYLPEACEHCGRHVEETGARFCAACGNRLAA
jgi:hypothetical protein